MVIIMKLYADTIFDGQMNKVTDQPDNNTVFEIIDGDISIYPGAIRKIQHNADFLDGAQKMDLTLGNRIDSNIGVVLGRAEQDAATGKWKIITPPKISFLNKNDTDYAGHKVDVVFAANGNILYSINSHYQFENSAPAPFILDMAYFNEIFSAYFISKQDLNDGYIKFLLEKMISREDWFKKDGGYREVSFIDALNGYLGKTENPKVMDLGYEFLSLCPDLVGLNVFKKLVKNDITKINNFNAFFKTVTDREGLRTLVEDSMENPRLQEKFFEYFNNENYVLPEQINALMKELTKNVNTRPNQDNIFKYFISNLKQPVENFAIGSFVFNQLESYYFHKKQYVLKTKVGKGISEKSYKQENEYSANCIYAMDMIMDYMGDFLTSDQKKRLVGMKELQEKEDFVEKNQDSIKEILLGKPREKFSTTQLNGFATAVLNNQSSRPTPVVVKEPENILEKYEEQIALLNDVNISDEVIELAKKYSLEKTNDDGDTEYTALVKTDDPENVKFSDEFANIIEMARADVARNQSTAGDGLTNPQAELDDAVRARIFACHVASAAEDSVKDYIEPEKNEKTETLETPESKTDLNEPESVKDVEPVIISQSAHRELIEHEIQQTSEYANNIPAPEKKKKGFGSFVKKLFESHEKAVDDIEKDAGERKDTKSEKWAGELKKFFKTVGTSAGISAAITIANVATAGGAGAIVGVTGCVAGMMIGYKKWRKDNTLDGQKPTFGQFLKSKSGIVSAASMAAVGLSYGIGGTAGMIAGRLVGLGTKVVAEVLTSTKTESSSQNVLKTMLVNTGAVALGGILGHQIGDLVGQGLNGMEFGNTRSMPEPAPEQTVQSDDSNHTKTNPFNDASNKIHVRALQSWGYDDAALANAENSVDSYNQANGTNVDSVKLIRLAEYSGANGGEHTLFGTGFQETHGISKQELDILANAVNADGGINMSEKVAAIYEKLLPLMNDRGQVSPVPQGVPGHGLFSYMGPNHPR